MMNPLSLFFRKHILFTLTATMIASSLWAAGAESPDSQRTDTDDEFMPASAPNRRPLGAHPRLSTEALQKEALFPAFPLTLDTFSSSPQVNRFWEHCETLIQTAVVNGNQREVHLAVTERFEAVLALLKREIEYRTIVQSGALSFSPAFAHLPEWPEEGAPNPFSPTPDGNAADQGEESQVASRLLQGPSSLHMSSSIWSDTVVPTDDAWPIDLGNLTLLPRHDPDPAEEEDASVIKAPSEFTDDDASEERPIYDATGSADDEGEEDDDDADEEVSGGEEFSDGEMFDVPSDDSAALWAKEQMQRWNTWSLLGYPPEQEDSARSSAGSLPIEGEGVLARQSSNALTAEEFKAVHSAIQEDMLRTLTGLAAQL